MVSYLSITALRAECPSFLFEYVGASRRVSCFLFEYLGAKEFWRCKP